MESNGHDEPFKDKSNAMDILSGPEASPLPSPPPRRKSLVGLKGIMATRRSWWETQTVSHGNSGVNPLSKSLPGIQPTASQNSLRSIVSTANRKFKDQENVEVSSSYVKGHAPGREPRASSRLLSSYDPPFSADLAESRNPEECNDGMGDSEPQPVLQELRDSSVPSSPTGAAATAREDEGNCCSNQNSAPGSPAAAIKPDEPYWKKFSSMWKKTPATDRKPPSSEENSLRAAGIHQNASAAVTAEPNHCNNLQQVSSLDIENEQVNPEEAIAAASPTQELQSPTSVESLSPNYSEAREAEPRRCSEIKMMNLNCMSEHVQDMTTYSEKTDNIATEWGSSIELLVEASVVPMPSPPKNINAHHHPEEPHAVADAPDKDCGMEIADHQKGTQPPSDIIAADQHFHLPDKQEVQLSGSQPIATGLNIGDDHSQLNTELGSDHITHDISGIDNQIPTEPAESVLATMQQVTGQPVSASRRPAPLKLQEGCSVQEMAYSAGLSPTSSPTRVRVASSLDFEADTDNEPLPESFAVDVSLDTPPLHVDTMPEPEAMDPDTSASEEDLQPPFVEPAAMAPPHGLTQSSRPAVFDSFSFGEPAQAADGTVADDVVASLAQLPFGGLLTLSSETQSKELMESAEIDLRPPETSEEPETFLQGGAERAQPMDADFLQVSLADGCGIEVAHENPMQATKLNRAAAQSVPEALARLFSNSIDSSLNGSIASDNAMQYDTDTYKDATAAIVAAEVPAIASNKTVFAAVSSEDNAPASPAHTIGAHPRSSMLPPRHPSPGPPSTRADGAGTDGESHLAIRAVASTGQNIGIREAVEQVLQSSPTSKVRSMNPATSRRTVGGVGDSIPLFVKDLQTESLLDDTNMEDWLSPSTVPPKNFNHLLDDPGSPGDAADIQKVCDSIRAAAQVDAVVMSDAAEAALVQSNVAVAQQPPSLPASLSQQRSGLIDSRPVNSQSQSAGTAATSGGNTIQCCKDDITADASSRRPSLTSTVSSPLKSPRGRVPATSHAGVPTKSPRGIPIATASKSVLSKPAAQPAPLKSPRRVHPLAATAAATSHVAAGKSPPRMAATAPSAVKSPGRSTSTTAGASASKSPRGVPVSKPTFMSRAVRVLPTAANAGSSVPKTPRATTITTTSMPKAQRVSCLPSAPSKTPRNSIIGAAPAPSKPTHIPSKLTGPSKVAARNAPATNALRTPRGATPAAPYTAAAAAKTSIPVSKPAAKPQAEVEAGSTTPRQSSLKRPLSSPVSANRLRTGRPVPVTPKVEKCTDVHMDDADSPALGLPNQPSRDPDETNAVCKTAVVPRLDFKTVLDQSNQAAESTREQPVAEEKQVVQQTSTAPEKELSGKVLAAGADFRKTPGRGMLDVTTTSLEAWTPELYMPPSATPATKALTQNHGLDVYNVNLQTTPFRMLSNVQLDAAVNAPLIDNSPLCWDEQDFDSDTQKILMRLAVSPAPPNLGVRDSQQLDDQDRKGSPAPSSLMEMKVQLLLQQVSEFKTKMQQLETDNMGLKDQISTLQFGQEFEKGGDDFEKDARQYAEAELHKVQAQKAQLSSRVHELEKQVEDAKRDAEISQKSNQDLVSRLSKLENERNYALDQVGFMDIEVTTLRSALSEHQQLLGAEQSKVAELNAALATEQDQRVKLIKENSESKKAMKQLMEQLITAQTEHKVALNEVEKANAKARKLEREKNAETVKVAQLNTQLKKQEAESKELMAMCSELLAVQEASVK